MKRIIAGAVALGFLVLQSGGANAQQIDGQVTRIDTSAGKITLRHGPIKKFDMDEGMTMVFRVSDPALLTGVKTGDKVKFDAEKINGQFTVTDLKKTK